MLIKSGDKINLVWFWNYIFGTV